MRGIYTPVTDIRRKVFTEVARMSYESNEMADYAKEIRDLPFKIMPGEDSSLRSSIFLERAIVSERIRLAMGLSLRPVTESVSATEDLEHSVIADKYYEPPLINVIKFACNKCPEKIIKVTSMCQGCLAHPCQEVCPKKAISFRNGRSHIDQDLCIKCGRCVTTCPYNAIADARRPCVRSCPVDAISVDKKNRRASIDYNKCISCGNCTVACPFSAISDVSMITDVIEAIRDKTQEVYACFAPSIEGQFGGVSVGEMIRALQYLGFTDAMEVSLGADATAYYEAQEAKEVAREGGHMTTSCCPAFYNMVAKHYPALLDKVSHTVSPMVATARYIKKRHPGATVVFIGPCIAKKSEVKRYKDAGKVGADFVLTFDELYAMFLAKNIDPEAMASSGVQQGSKYGKNFAAAGGVTAAVQEVLAEEKFDMPVSCVKCSGAAECKKALMLLRVGKLNETIIEGMACEGGCVNGPAKISDVRESVGMRRQLMLSVDDRSIADNLEMSDFKEIDMKDGRN